MCISFFFKCVEVLVCLSISWFKMIKLWFRVFSEWCVRLDKVIVFWWFFWIVVMMLLKCLLIVNIKKDKCWFCCVMVFVSLILLLLRVCICICKVLMLFDIVVLNSDFKIFLIKLKSFFFYFKDWKNVFCGGNVVVGMRWWICFIVVLMLVIYLIWGWFMVLMIWFVVMYCGML